MGSQNDFHPQPRDRFPQVEATKGALSTFVGGAYFDTSSCPVERWAPAGAAPFWVLLFAMAAATGACCTLCALVARWDGGGGWGRDGLGSLKGEGEEGEGGGGYFSVVLNFASWSKMVVFSFGGV